MKDSRSSLHTTPWHALDRGEVYARTKSRHGGLSDAEAEKRRRIYGPNTIETEERGGALWIFVRQFLNPLIALLVVAAIITTFLGAHLDTVIIAIAVVFNTVIGFFHERRAYSALKSLQKEELLYAWVVRDSPQQDGAIRRVKAEEVVPGDVIKLKPGDRVPADARLVSAHELETNEAILTGESEPVRKSTDAVKPGAVMGDRTNIVWMGTVVVDGKGEAVVVATGGETEYGKIAYLLQKTKRERTPFQKNIVKLGRFLGVASVIVTAGIVLLGISVGNSLEEMFLVAVAVVVSAIPEGLPVALTIILAVGMVRILRKHGLVRELAATEALGSTNVILTDKTGTLTKGEMRVRDILLPTRSRGIFEMSHTDLGDEQASTTASSAVALKIGLLISEVVIENAEDDLHAWRIHGRPTDKAMTLAALQAGFSREEFFEEYEVIDEVPFNSERKFSGSLRQKKKGRGKGSHTFFFGGAPEVIMPFIKRVHIAGRATTLTDSERARVLERVSEFAQRGLRTILVGYTEVSKREVAHMKGPQDHQPQTLFNNAVLAGILVLQDPVREDVAEVIAASRRAGIRTVIVTGDHSLTARAVAEEVGLMRPGQHSLSIMEGSELAGMSEEDIARHVRSIDVFSRVSPSDKLNIVGAWQKHGAVVAMSGDGVNDAPALRKADVGVAVGSGTDIAKDAADIILLNNSFRTIVSAVREGRVILDNLKKVVTFLLTSSFTEIMLIAVSLLLGLPLPVLPAQILWVNMVSNSPPSMALAFEPAESDVLSRPPRERGEPLIDSQMRFLIGIIGTLTNIVLIGLFLFFVQSIDDIDHVRTIVFVALAANALLFVFSIRSLRKPLWRINPFSNLTLWGAVAIGFGLVVAGVYLPPLQVILRTVPLGMLEWIILIGFAMVNIAAIEIGKWIYMRRQMTTNEPSDKTRGA